MADFEPNNHPIVKLINNNKVKQIIKEFEKREKLLNDVKEYLGIKEKEK